MGKEEETSGPSSNYTGEEARGQCMVQLVRYEGGGGGRPDLWRGGEVPQIHARNTSERYVARNEER